MSLKIGAEIPDLPEWYSESLKRLFRRMLSLGPDSRPSSSEINKAIRQKSTGTESGSNKKNPRVTERITPESSSYRETHNEIHSDPIESRRKTNSASGLKLVIGLFVGFIAIVILINLGGNEPILPTIITTTPNSITQNSGVSGGNITADGGAAVTSRGVVWSTRQNPTIASSSGRTTNGNGTGIYTSILTGLSPGMTYYIRAYATNNAGTQYGEQRSFSTQSVVPISRGRDAQTAVVNVTNPATGRVWMDRNLGASRAATSSTDAQAYGDLYQWGRAADGHQKRTSATTTTLSSGDQPGHGSFILYISE
jgi:serine/threonine protein kinase